MDGEVEGEVEVRGRRTNLSIRLGSALSILERCDFSALPGVVVVIQYRHH
jgi:hypothetical protein